MTEEARKHSDTVKDKATRTAGQAQDAAYDTAGAAQEQGESAWQKVKEVVTDAYEHVCFFLTLITMRLVVLGQRHVGSL